MMAEWAKVTFGEVLRRVERFETRDELTNYHFAGTYSFARGIFAGEWKLGSTFSLPKVHRIHKGDFVYCQIMAWEGAFGLVPEEADECVMSGTFVVYDINREKIDPKFLDYFFKLPLNWHTIGNQSTGTDIRRRSLHPQQFEKAIITLPHLPEQHRIVARIEELSSKIEEAKGLGRQAQENTEFLVQSRINQIIEQNVTSKRWGLALLPELVVHDAHSIKRGPFGSHLRKEFFMETGYKIYEQKHAIYGDFTAGTYYIDKEKFEQLKAFEVKPGDLIISCSGTIGKVAIVPENATPGIINQALLKLTLDTSKINRRFFKFIFESEFIKKEVAMISPGSAMKNIGSTGTLKKIKFPLPTIEEQQDFVAYFDKLETNVIELRGYQKETSAQLEALFPSVLDRAFKGEL